MKRRDALKTMGGLAGAAAAARVLPGCGDNALPPGIDHLVVVMMENRSYDHLFGARALQGLGGDGLTATMSNPGQDGLPVGAYEATTGNLCVPDPPHGWTAAHNAFADGANSGFVLAHQASHGDPSALGVTPVQSPSICARAASRSRLIFASACAGSRSRRQAAPAATVPAPLATSASMRPKHEVNVTCTFAPKRLNEMPMRF